MKVTAQHEVTFRLDDEEQFVVPGRNPRTFFKVDTIMIRLGYTTPAVFALGDRCKKDGGDSKAWGRFGQSVNIPDAEKWMKAAVEHLFNLKEIG